ncbi:MAG TPA: TetR family transcriptional regulator C-terminal domain-containing protein, partial [Vicinamibacterales bacterium]|nr:TetR family transcriptional regulator C-terminal domain-containing protein [Vicinamibacterales bacterium]
LFGARRVISTIDNLETTGHIEAVPQANVREKLIEAGLEMLYRAGFNGSGVQDITDLAGVPKGSFYNHFESKEALALAALERHWTLGSQRRAVLYDESVEPVERLRRYFNLLGEVLAGRGYSRGCFLGNFSLELSDQSPAVRDRLSTLLAAWTAALEHCIRDAQQTGAVRHDLDAHVLATFLLSAWEGAVLRAKVDKQGMALDQFMTVTFSTILSK